MKDISSVQNGWLLAKKNKLGVLLKLRFIQIRKMAYESGSYAVFFLIVFIFAVAFTYYVHRDEVGSMKLFCLIGIVILGIHHSRKDKTFVLKHVAYPYREMAIEYLFLSLPFLIFSIYFMRFASLSALVLTILAIPYINIEVKKETYNKTIQFIPAPMFEWKSGVRKTYYVFVFLYAAALVSSWFKILPLILLWFLTTLILTFYDENEPQNLLTEGKFSNEKIFLQTKIISHLKILLLLYVPILVINTIFNKDYLLINLGYLIAQASLLIFGITTKYKHYVPNFKLINNSSFTAVIALIGALPIFFMIPFLLAIVNYTKAITNLKPYFRND